MQDALVSECEKAEEQGVTSELPGRGDVHHVDKIESRETNVWLARPTVERG